MNPTTKLSERFKTRIAHQFEAIRDINAKYKTPRIKMTPWAKASLLGIRIYLIILLSILLYRFITLIT
jgi:hypothetical protein